MRGSARDSREDSIFNRRHSGRLIWLAAIASQVAVATAAHAQFLRDPPLLPPAATTDRDRAVGCMANAIVYEAGYEPIEGQQAVAEVILNRVRSPLYPKTVCGVVFDGSTRATGCQFTFTCDGSMRRRLPEALKAAARAIAESALDGTLPDRVAGATHYHADYVSPRWAPSLVRVAKIGAHIFYRLPGTRDALAQPAAYSPVGEPLFPSGSVIAGGGVSHVTRAIQPPRLFAPWGLMMAVPPR
jgi:spore germination cell wall hydrolase CwlJ-like protein